MFCLYLDLLFLGLSNISSQCNLIGSMNEAYNSNAMAAFVICTDQENQCRTNLIVEETK